jgi:hypothetical protein
LDLFLFGVRAIEGDAIPERVRKGERPDLEADRSRFGRFVIEERVGHGPHPADRAGRVVQYAGGVGDRTVIAPFPDELQVAVQDGEDRTEIVCRHRDHETFERRDVPCLFQIRPVEEVEFPGLPVLLFGFQRQFKLLNRTRDGVPEDVGRDGFAKEIVRPFFQRFDDRFERWRRGEEGERQKGVFAKCLFEERKSAPPVQIEFRENDQFPPIFRQDPERLLATGRLVNGVARRGQNGRVSRPLPRIGVHDEDAWMAHELGNCIMPGPG